MSWDREKNTEYYINRKRRNKVTNNISKLAKLDCLLNVGENNILLETLQFYQSLYSSTCTYPVFFTRDLHHTHLDSDNWHQCDGKLTLQECSLSFNFMKKCQVSQRVVMALLLILVNTFFFYWTSFRRFSKYGYNRGSLSLSLSWSISWCEYSYSIGPQQIGFLKVKLNSDNVRFILGLIFHTSHHNIHGYLLLVDSERALDTPE